MPFSFVFMLFNQPDGFESQTEVTPNTDRNTFNVGQFADKVGLGSPVAGTYVAIAAQN